MGGEFARIVFNGANLALLVANFLDSLRELLSLFS